MPLLARISHHLDLYRYWLAKRGSRPMPARSDINPGDIPALLPYLGLVNKVVGQFRWRLTGTAVADKIGRNLTGTVVGSQITNAPESVAALQSIFERTFASAHPVFATGEHKTKWGIQDTWAMCDGFLVVSVTAPSGSVAGSGSASEC